jgi:ubiquinone biosynthesis protein
MSSIIRRFRITLPVDLALTLKVIVTLESLGKSLDPEFDFTAAARPFVRRVRISHLGEWTRKERVVDLLEDALRLGRSLPYDTYEVLKKLRSGRLRLNLDIDGLDRAVREIDRSANRLSFAVVIAGILVGSSFVTREGIGPSLFGFPLLGLAGFLLAGFLGIWFLVGILRSGRL